MGPGANTMSTSTNIKLFSVPKLADDGSNWVTVKILLLTAFGARGLTKYIEGRARKPAAYEFGDGAARLVGSKVTLTDEELEALEDKHDDHNQKESQIKQQIFECVSNRVLMMLQGQGTAAEVWLGLCREYEGKSALVVIDTRRRLQDMRCAEDANIRDHIAEMTRMQELLAGMGTKMEDDEFTTILIGSLPQSYRPVVSTILTASRIMRTTLDSATLIGQLYEEADHRKTQGQDDRSRETAALAGSGGKRGNARGGKPKSDRAKLKCPNCSKTGHTKEDCFAPGGGKEGQWPKHWKQAKEDSGTDTKPKATAAVAASIVDASDDGNDGEFVFAADTPSTDKPVRASAAAAAPVMRSTLLDCGASRHYLAEAKSLTNPRSIAPEPVGTADGREFVCTLEGDAFMDLPNGDKTTRVRLKNALYSKSLAYNLISVSCLDKAGYKVLIGDSCATILSPKSLPIARIPLANGLYRIANTGTTSHHAAKHTAGAAVLKTDINDLHARMGHISHRALQDMVAKGMVDGVELDPNVEPLFCEVCALCKAKRQPFPKESETKAKRYGDKVVSDICGPFPTRSINHDEYFIQFIDLASREGKVYFLSKKSEAFGKYKNKAWMYVHRDGAIIRIFGVDRGQEYLSHEFSDYLES
ncbi:hypothetical protein HGRIS_014936 [Hohenbuehelia grisea]|uniref:CCHC-type domain-containing protein n=1 Tax=Hohenbuehelia grisea TaxID=104357 RepID=A0ABR3JB54_9AGAR